MHDQLEQWFKVIGAFLKSECLRRTGNLSIPYDRGDRIRLQAPCLVPSASIAGVDLNNLTRGLYNHCNADERALVALWEQAANTSHSHPTSEHALRMSLRRCFPMVPWNVPRHADSRVRLVQVLTVISWQYGGFTTDRWPLRVWTNSGVLRLEAEGLEWPGYRRRFRKPLRFHIQDAMREMFGTSGYIPADVSAAYRYLGDVLPELHWELTVVFGALAHAELGKGFKNALLDGFDIFDAGEEREPGKPHDFGNNSPWVAALRAVDTCSELYVAEIAKVLKPVVKKGDVYKWFGKDPRQTFKLDDPAKKAELRHRLQQLELHVYGRDVGLDESVLKLLQLQEMLR